MKWLALLPVYILSWIVKWPLSVFAVIFCSTPDRLHLICFRWLETVDNNLSGDYGWKQEHLAGGDVLSNWNRIRWLWRNGGSSLNYNQLGCTFNEGFELYTPNPRPFEMRTDGYWYYNNTWPLSKGKSLQVAFGWNVFGPQLGRCKYVCTIRIISVKNGE